ncbi:MAG: HAD-like domain-containing protein [Monoraphidium minutum]|nr:MAG: HAD-like domain-containing protein [Monoraphidium minutum]
MGPHMPRSTCSLSPVPSHPLAMFPPGSALSMVGNSVHSRPGARVRLRSWSAAHAPAERQVWRTVVGLSRPRSPRLQNSLDCRHFNQERSQKQQRSALRVICRHQTGTKMQLRSFLHNRTLTKTCCPGRSSNGPRMAAAGARQRQREQRAARQTRCRAQAQAGPDPVKGVIFDVDGVLCSSEHLSRMSAAAALKRLYGIDPSPDEFIPFGGMGEGPFLTGVAEKYAVRGFDVAEATAAFFDIYINTYCRGPAAARIGYPGAVELVRALRGAGLATAVASSAERVKIDANLEAAGFDAADFGVVVSGTSFQRNKPAPDVFLAAAEGLRLEPRHCVVLEDAPAGIKAAKAAGMRVIGVATTLSIEEMRREGPDMVFDDISRVTVADVTGLVARGAAAAAAQQ